MRLRDAMSKYRAVYQTIGGSKFLGDILAPTMDQNPNRMEQGRVFLKTHPDVKNVGVNDLIIANGKIYLVCDNPGSDREKTVYNLFKLLRMDKQFTWSRPQQIVDPVTGLKRSHDETVGMGTAWCCLEVDRELHDSRMVPAEQYTVYTNAGLQLNDILGTFTVTFVTTQLGVTYARVK
jgi:hypothetical protein